MFSVTNAGGDNGRVRLLLLLLMGPALLDGATAAEVRAKVGVYGWADMPPSADPLHDWMGRMQSLGVHTVRLTIAPCFWDPLGPSQPKLPLDRLAQRPDYAAVFASPAFQTILLTAYPLASCDAAGDILYRGQMTADQLTAVHDEMRNFALILRREWPGKTFVIGNWESEHDAYETTMWDVFLAYTQTWISAVHDGGKAADQAGYAGKTYTLFEFVNLDDATGATAHAAGAVVAPLSGLLRALPALRDVDFWSYSSWNSVVYANDDGSANRASFHKAFAAIRAACQSAGQDCSSRIIVGELGYLYNYDDAQGSGLAALVQACLTEGARYVVSWVSYDPRDGDVVVGGVTYDHSRFGKFDQSGKITPQGEALRKWMTYGIPAAKPASRPRVPKAALACDPTLILREGQLLGRGGL